ncbi:MAG: glycerol-3-phosphate 1-O-acyltransferase PlsY [Clostridia bacterium]|nr:glycerol-3-phosphate 1-O-acyltransferase PlsY [Clostridia bacterium]
MVLAIAIFVALLSYLIGSINTSIILSKSIYGTDIRTSGSGNAGATNMLRTHGKGIAIATLICDVLKGMIAIAIAAWADIALNDLSKTAILTPFASQYVLGNLKYIAGVFVVLGHDFPVFFGFRGGKGVATSLGVALTLDWQVGLIIAVIALVIMASSRYVSLGSICAAALYPVVLFTYLMVNEMSTLDKKLGYIVMAFVLALLLIIKHHSNIKKLRLGTENKLFEKKAEEPVNEDQESKEEE